MSRKSRRQRAEARRRKLLAERALPPALLPIPVPLPIPDPHPDHGPAEAIPRDESGRIPAYYYCSKAELAAWGIDDLPARRRRRDGWSAERMATFLRTLAATASVSDAARAVGCSRQSAYALYNAPDAAAFRAAWDAALRNAVNVLATTAFDRAVNGVEEIVYYKGQRVGVRWKYDNRMLMSLLAAHDPMRYAPLDELERWRRFRDIEPHGPLEPALDRLASAERAWGAALPEPEQLPAGLLAMENEGVQVSELSTFESARLDHATATEPSAPPAHDTPDDAREGIAPSPAAIRAAIDFESDPASGARSSGGASAGSPSETAGGVRPLISRT